MKFPTDDQNKIIMQVNKAANIALTNYLNAKKAGVRESIVLELWEAYSHVNAVRNNIEAEFRG